jgi:hypothetical protein
MITALMIIAGLIKLILDTISAKKYDIFIKYILLDISCFFFFFFKAARSGLINLYYNNNKYYLNSHNYK